MEQVETLPDTNLRVKQKPETTAPVRHEQLSLWSAVVPGSLSDNHPLQAGPDSGLNIRLGADVIQALNAGIPVTLRLNPEGGGVSATGDLSVSGDGVFGGSITLSGSVRDMSGHMRGISLEWDGNASSEMSGTAWLPSYANIPTVGATFLAPDSGAVYFVYSAKMQTSIAGASAQMSFELFQGTSSAGEQIFAPTGSRSVDVATTNPVSGSWVYGISTLIPGQSYYVRLSQRMSSSTAVGIVWGRSLICVPRI
jgi:hypothetical protein